MVLGVERNLSAKEVKCNVGGSVVLITNYPAIDVVEEVCTVELEEPIAVTGSSATFSFRGVGSDIVGFSCKLDGDQLANCVLTQCCTIL